jgi:hypothetical protein
MGGRFPKIVAEYEENANSIFMVFFAPLASFAVDCSLAGS